MCSPRPFGVLTSVNGVHCPPEQVPLPQGCPQVPQLFASLEPSMHVPLQLMKPAVEQTQLLF